MLGGRACRCDRGGCSNGDRPVSSRIASPAAAPWRVRAPPVPRYLEDEAFRRRIGAQLNKSEALHALRNFLFLANVGHTAAVPLDDQANQALCLTVVTNAVILWSTVYMARVLKQLRAEGHEVSDHDVAHLSPARSRTSTRSAGTTSTRRWRGGGFRPGRSAGRVACDQRCG